MQSENVEGPSAEGKGGADHGSAPTAGRQQPVDKLAAAASQVQVGEADQSDRSVVGGGSDGPDGGLLVLSPQLPARDLLPGRVGGQGTGAVPVLDFWVEARLHRDPCVTLPPGA